MEITLLTLYNLEGNLRKDQFREDGGKTSFPHYNDMHVKQSPRIVFCH